MTALACKYYCASLFLVKGHRHKKYSLSVCTVYGYTYKYAVVRKISLLQNEKSEYCYMAKYGAKVLLIEKP